MKVYYAHCMAIYDTPQEMRDIELLKKMGFEILNPNTKEHQEKASKVSNKMEYFAGLVKSCHGIVFRGLPGGVISAGVKYEIDVAKFNGIPVLEIPSFFNRGYLTPDETLDYYREAGKR